MEKLLTWSPFCRHWLGACIALVFALPWSFAESGSDHREWQHSRGESHPFRFASVSPGSETKED
jgi:hypothetical protein